MLLPPIIRPPLPQRKKKAEYAAFSPKRRAFALSPRYIDPLRRRRDAALLLLERLHRERHLAVVRAHREMLRESWAAEGGCVRKSFC